MTSSFLAGISPIERNTVSAHENNLNTSTQLIAVLVNEKIYPSIEGKLRWYTTKYLQKQYPQSKALIFKINPESYTAPEISKLLENVYFDGLKDQSSRLI